ncbi:MAG: polysaccharide biosynthesis tyrosine autokinase [Gammaproteobacteria bacterium]|jgi:polysaccharide biosynthesis transport protein|nr:polysaccharide biosynthesis tyrosine autokinase [Gammaproteobacteria bacterium]MBT4492093.1 polysaccharide biosynthesis tyrosine autokinase [Gammaproteobacteria bacterium]MBT7372345.1 polysaccharide biosynthesis tyrosine autokinase [Gammaproteobacteria bacterium]
MSTPAEFYDDDIIDYRYYIDLIRTVLLKNYRTIVGFCFASVLLSVLYVQSQAPAYLATVTLHIAPNDLAMFSFEKWMFSDDDKFQDTQIGVLQSKKLLRQVVRELDLHKVEKLTPASFDAGIAAIVKDWLATLKAEKVELYDTSEEEQIASAAWELGTLISIAKPLGREYSNLLNVTVQTTHPELSAKTANIMADKYMNLVFENEIENAKKNQQFLTDRLSILREDLRLAEQRLQDYREEENILTNSSGQNELDQELTSLSNRFFEARENRLRQESLYQQVRNINGSRKSWENLPAISNHSSISEIQSDLFTLNQRRGELSKRYGSRHNKMIALESEIQSATRALNNQVRDIIEGIRSEYELTRKLEVAAEQTLNGVRDRKQEQGRKGFEFNELTQEVEAKRQVYAIFLERLNQDGASGPVRNDNLWVADPAVVPKHGQRTPLSRAGFVALLLSFGFAVGIGLLFELTSNTISTGDDVEKKLGVPLLGYLPLIKNEAQKPGMTLDEYLNNPESRFSEALRTVRTSITLSTLSQKNANNFLITSSQSSEGKTSVSLSLAAAFGQTSKVVIIDGDLRKPSLERILNTSNHRFPGLADVIANTVTLDEAIQHFPDKNIDVIFSGSRTIKPLELLSSLQFTQLMEELGNRYDNVIIDSPPCISVSDAYVLSTQVDSIIFVSKANEVPVPVIRNCLNRFSSIDTEIAGVLLNQIDLEAAHNYGRYQDYYDYHGYGENQAELSVVKT